MAPKGDRHISMSFRSIRLQVHLPTDRINKMFKIFPNLNNWKEKKDSNGAFLRSFSGLLSFVNASLIFVSYVRVCCNYQSLVNILWDKLHTHGRYGYRHGLTE